MRLAAIRKLMARLREQTAITRPNNQKVSEWVDGYLNSCALNGREVAILTQWCISKELEARWETFGNCFEPTKKEHQLFAKEIPAVLELFAQSGLRVSWWITFNRSYLDSGRINPEIERVYKMMIKNLAEMSGSVRSIAILDWEDDVLLKRPEPIQADVSQLVPRRAWEVELKRHSNWVREEAKIVQTDEEIKKDVLLQIACEAEEGRLLLSADSPVGQEFILVPLELPERYDFFTLLAPSFKDRIVAILHPYPWRL